MVHRGEEIGGGGGRGREVKIIRGYETFRGGGAVVCFVSMYCYVEENL